MVQCRILTLHARLFKVPAGTLTPDGPFIYCDFAGLTGSITSGSVFSCSNSGFVTFLAGDTGYVVISATAAGITLTNSIPMSVSVGLGQ